MIDKKISYTVADSLPVKTLMDEDLIKSAKSGKLIPIHIQLIPTNLCNLNCSFCSCANRQKTLEMDFELMKKIIDKCKKLGTKAVTISGGGEPLLYKKFNEMINYFVDNGIKIGLVSNGIALHKADFSILNKITWCRISNGDERTFTDEYKNRLITVIENTPNVDWAISHVVSPKPNLEEIARVIRFANEHKLTHVRLVADLYTPYAIDMSMIKDYLLKNNINDDKVIYQPRKAFTKGGDCYIGYLRPNIGADAKVYLCCGVQYALDPPTNDLPQELCLGDAIDIDKIIEKSNIPANGNICVKCYYSTYNEVLKSLLSEIEHKEFV